MPNVGNLNNLIVNNVLPFGYSLSQNASKQSQEMVFLPISDALGELTEGQTVEAYVYYAQDGSMHATQKKVAINLGDFALLNCTGVTDFGAFFDYGVDRDLLVPKSMQHKPMDEGLSYVVCLLHDEENRKLIGCTKLHRYLEETTDELDLGQSADALVFDETPLGFKCVVNKQYQGLLFKSDLLKKLNIGDELTVFIKNIREDGKIDLSLQKQGKAGRNDLAADIIDDLIAHGGMSTLTDKSSADEIYARYKVSKGAYKRAIGTLYKNKKIMLSKTHISLVDKE
jgi:predicted RNA-binding protein (virulence factor B family)